jgi:hypothetical protein
MTLVERPAAGLRLAVTTSMKPSETLLEDATQLAAELNVPIFTRRTVTLTRIFEETNAVRLLVVGPDRWTLHDHKANVEYFYHPNMIQVRWQNLDHGDRDLFAEATQLKSGDSILDCTVGFAAEAIIASRLVGASGLIIGLESVAELAAITRNGVASFKMQSKGIQEAMRRVNIVTADYRDYLPKCATSSIDVVYFDPFFPSRMPGSENSVGPLHHFGNASPLCAQSVTEARRVARRRVIIKHPFWAKLPEELKDEISEVVSTKKRMVLYSVLEAF